MSPATPGPATPRPDRSSGVRLGRPVLLAALVFLVALNLRPALTSVGPLLGQVGVDEGLGEGWLGLLGALPLLAFAAVSPLVHRWSSRLGAERAVLVALLVLAAAVGLRSYGGTAGLWLGTLVAGGAIAVGNVLVPALVKRDFPRHVAGATGVSSAFMGLAAATASAVAVPAALLLGWRAALALWAVPALLVALLWLVRARPAPAVASGPATAADRAAGPVWRQRTAWLLTAYMGLQSTSFYMLVTWLPSIEADAGVPAAQAGVHLFGYQLTGLLAGLAIPRLMRRPDSQVAAAVSATVPVLVAVVGLLVAPQAGLLWALLAGLGNGSSLVVALTLISLRGRSGAETTRLSGMAQSLGYLLAAGGPLAAGVLAERTGTWFASLTLVALLAALQLLVALRVGRVPADRRP